MHTQSPFDRLHGVAFSAICTLFLLLLLFWGVSSCGQPNPSPHTTTTGMAAKSNQEAIPHLLKQIPAPEGIGKGVLAPNHQVYFAAYYSVPVLDELTFIADIQMPKFDSPYGPILNDIDVNPSTGLVYVLDGFADVIDIISNTALITSLVGIAGPPLHVVTDRDSGEVYVFYTAYINDEVEPHALVLSGTKIITDMLLPLFIQSAAYNPFDGQVYVAGHIRGGELIRENALITIDNYQVTKFVHPLDEPQIDVADLAINEKNGDVYILLSTRIVYWDRVNPLKSIDLYAQGYRGLECITVDPIRGWAYVCAWTGYPSYALVIDQNILKEAIPIAYRPQSMAVDTKHDYVYVAHYSPAALSVIRETKLITTLDTLGAGATDVIVDEERERIYVPNADDGSVTIFGYEPITESSSWLDFLPFIQR